MAPRKTSRLAELDGDGKIDVGEDESLGPAPRSLLGDGLRCVQSERPDRRKRGATGEAQTETAERSGTAAEGGECCETRETHEE